MNFSFIIVTDGHKQKVENVLASIYAQKIPPQDYEIIIVGNYQPPELKFRIEDTEFVDLRAEDGSLLKVISFDEAPVNRHITKKKNLGIAAAKGRISVVMHDYINLDPNWVKGMEEFGEDFDACVNPLRYENGQRAIDWILQPYHSIPENKLKKFLDEKHGYPIAGDLIRLPYDVAPQGQLSQFGYLPGNFYVVKTDLAREIKLDENRKWGEEEDLDFSFRFTRKYRFKLNMKSGCTFKMGGRPIGHREITPRIKELLNEFIEKEGLNSPQIPEAAREHMQGEKDYVFYFSENEMTQDEAVEAAKWQFIDSGYELAEIQVEHDCISGTIKRKTK